VVFRPLATRGRFCIILTLTLHRLSLRTTFPISHFTNHTLTWNQSHTLYNTHSDPDQFAEYCLAFIALPVIATLQSTSVFSKSKSSLSSFHSYIDPSLCIWFLVRSLECIACLGSLFSLVVLDSVRPCLDYYYEHGLSLLFWSLDYVRPQIDPVCSLGCSCVLPMHTPLLLFGPHLCLIKTCIWICMPHSSVTPLH